MAGRGGGGIKFGKVEVSSSTESLEEMKKQLISILKEIGYPEIEEERASPDIVEETNDEDEKPIDLEDLEELPDDEVPELPEPAPWAKRR